jgi:hypothetical protein
MMRQPTILIIDNPVQLNVLQISQPYFGEGTFLKNIIYDPLLTNVYFDVVNQKLFIYKGYFYKNARASLKVLGNKRYDASFNISIVSTMSSSF